MTIETSYGTSVTTTYLCSVSPPKGYRFAFEKEAKKLSPNGYADVLGKETPVRVTLRGYSIEWPSPIDHLSDLSQEALVNLFNRFLVSEK